MALSQHTWEHPFALHLDHFFQEAAILTAVSRFNGEECSQATPPAMIMVRVTGKQLSKGQ